MPDPRRGAIPPDEPGADVFLEDVEKDGAPLIPKIRNNFNCLQQTGEFCPNSGSGNNQ